MNDTLTREQALLMLHDHLGEHVRFGLHVPGTDDEPMSREVIGIHGELRHPFMLQVDVPLPDLVRETFGSVYTIGGQGICLPPLPGTISYSNHGLDFALTDGLALRIAWRDHDAAERE
jgi:hypothetical protein